MPHERPAGEQIDRPALQLPGTRAGHSEADALAAGPRLFDRGMHDVEEGGHLLDLVDHHPFDGRCGIDLLAQLPRPEAVTVLEFRVEEIDPERGTGPEMLPEKRRLPRAARPEEQQTARFTDRKRPWEHTPNLYAELGVRSNWLFSCRCDPPIVAGSCSLTTEKGILLSRKS